ncbi:MAG: protein kinase [bacterium]|nr:protein kinase [bacterium]
MTKTAFISTLLLLLLSFNATLSGQVAAGPQYKIDSWGNENGLPYNTIWSIVQTRDGYIWIGADGGLLRFDGLNFLIFNKDTTPGFNDGLIKALFEDSRGDLWIGTVGGELLIYKNGTFKQFSTGDGFLGGKKVNDIKEDRQGNVWIGTEGHGIYRFGGNRFTRYTTIQGLPHDDVTCLHYSGRGNLWIGTGNGFSHVRGDRFINYTIPGDIPEANVVNAIVEDSGGILRIGTSAGLYRMQGEKISHSPVTPGPPNPKIYSLFRDSRENIWIGTKDRGLYLYRDGVFSNISKPEWLTDRVYYITEDRAGSLWTGMIASGLHRLREMKIKPLGVPEGLSSDSVWTLYQNPDSPDSDLWIGTYNGLNRLKNGRLSQINAADGSPFNFVFAIHQDTHGNVWVGTENGLSRLILTKSGVSAAKTPVNALVRAILEDRSGKLWVGTADGLLKKEKQSDHFDHVMDGNIMGIGEDPDANLWFSVMQGGLVRHKDGNFTTYMEKDGLIGNTLSSFYIDNDSVIWIASSNGLSRFKEGSFSNYTKADGLFSNSISQVLDDGIGYFWFSCVEGIFRVRKTHFDDYSRGKTDRIPSLSYTTDDGMRSSQCNDGFQGGCRTPDGRLWFATIKGVVIIDPTNVKTNRAPPPVLIEQVLVDGEAVDIDKNITSQPGGGERITLRYTALDFLNPKTLRFRYMMEGYDPRWIEAGSLRLAHYTNLDAGTYRFRVTASNNDRLWNETGASIRINITPVWKTWWVIILGSIGSIVILYIVFYFSRKYMRLSIFWKNQTYVANYKLLEKIGAGGMGTVYKAQSLTGKSLVAIKLLNEDLFQDETVRRRFKQEAAIIDRLDHPNIVRIIERGQSKQTMFIAMELLEGKTLEQKIDEEGPLDMEEALHIMVQIAAGVAEIHARNIVHRDLKPGNIILLEKEENPDFVKLLDFGLAKLKYQTRLTQTGVMIGTIYYMAPEVFGSAGWSGASDIYSLGVMFHEILTGKTPFKGESSMEILGQIMKNQLTEPITERPDIPVRLNRMVVKMMAAESGDRPGIMELLDTLRRFRLGKVGE